MMTKTKIFSQDEHFGCCKTPTDGGGNNIDDDDDVLLFWFFWEIWEFWEENTNCVEYEEFKRLDS